MPYSCGAATHGVAARNRARMESIVIAVRTRAPAKRAARPSRGGAAAARRCATTSQTVASEQTKSFDTQAINQPLFTSLLDEAYIGSGENGKRYRHHQPASHLVGGLPVLILKFQTIQSCIPAALPGCNCGATQARAGTCVHVFPTDFALFARPMGAPLCKISF
jgi:hypothetical protein